MSDRRKNARNWKIHTDTILGPGVRVNGNIRFSGVLRTQGDILGDVMPAADADGSIVVSKSGSIAGSIKATHIVVCGRVQGNAQASESIEVQDGACVLGSVSYRRLAIQPGGVIEGALIPVAAGAGEEEGQHRRPQAEPPTGEPYLATGAVARWQYAAEWRKLGMVAALLVAAVAVVWTIWSSVISARPPAEEPPATVAPTVTAAPTDREAETEVPPAVSEVKEVAPPVARPMPPAPPVPPAPAAAPSQPPEPVVSKPVPASATVTPSPDGKAVVEVQGDDPDKSAEFVFVTCRESCVLIKKGRQDSGEGTRMALTKGTKKRIAIAPNDLLRVAAGQDVDMFYQGRKVARYVLQGGGWMNFVAKPGGQ